MTGRCCGAAADSRHFRCRWVGETPGIGRTIRHAADRRIAGPGRSSGRSQLRGGLPWQTQTAEHGQNKRCHAEHAELSRASDNEVSRGFSQTRRSTLPCDVRPRSFFDRTGQSCLPVDVRFLPKACHVVCFGQPAKAALQPKSEASVTIGHGARRIDQRTAFARSRW